MCLQFHREGKRHTCAPAPASDEAAAAAAACAASMDCCMLRLSLLEASVVDAAPAPLLLAGVPVLLGPFAVWGAVFLDAACSAAVVLDDGPLLAPFLTPSLHQHDRVTNWA